MNICEQLAREILQVDAEGNSITDRYQAIIEQGLKPLPESAEKRRVLIIGAGIAGLVAGSLLKKAGHQVFIVEANDDRIGGRVKTLHPKAGKASPFHDPKQYAEAGAMRIPEPHKLVGTYIDNVFKLEKREFYNVDVAPDDPTKKVNRTWLRTNGQQTRKQNFYRDDNDAPNMGFPIGQHAGKSSTQLLDEALQPAKDLILPERKPKESDHDYSERQVQGWTQVIEKWGDYSMRRYLTEFFGEDPHVEGVLDFIGTFENLTSRMSYSFIQSFIETGYINAETVYHELPGGNWKLPAAFLEQGLLDETDIFMNNRVVDLHYSPEQDKPGTANAAHEGRPGVWVRTINEPAGKRGHSQNGAHTRIQREFTADMCIVTVPFSALRFVNVTPELPYGKRRAIQELHYDSATKVLLEFSERFWEWDEATWREKMGGEYRGHHSHGGGSISDNANRFMYYPSHPVEGSHGGVILAAYVWADDARRWDSIPSEDRYDFALRGLTEVYGPGIKRYFTGVGRTESWMSNFYAFGEAAIFLPGQLRHTHPNIAPAAGNLHFAGEHTSLKHAWIEGAIESGVRTALEVHTAAGGTAAPASDKQ